MWVDGHQKMDFSTNVLCCICGRDARESQIIFQPIFIAHKSKTETRFHTYFSQKRQ